MPPGVGLNHTGDVPWPKRKHLLYVCGSLVVATSLILCSTRPSQQGSRQLVVASPASHGWSPKVVVIPIGRYPRYSSMNATPAVSVLAQAGGGALPQRAGGRADRALRCALAEDCYRSGFIIEAFPLLR